MKIMPAIIALLLVLISSCVSFAASSSIATFADGLAPTAEIYVSTSGSDATGDGSITSPYATIGFALNQATPGTAVRIQPGIYANVSVSNITGTAAQPIWAGGIDGQARPIINGGGEGLKITKGQYLIIHDLEVRNASFNGINCDDGGEVSNPNAAHHLIFDNIYVHSIGGTGNQDALKLSGIRDFFVLNSRFERSGGGTSGSGIDMVGCRDGVVAACEFRELSGSGVQCKGGTENVEIRWSFFNDAGFRAVNIGGSTGFQFFRPQLSATGDNFEARSIRVLSNVIENTGPLSFVGSVDSLVASNTIIDPVNWVFRILQETASSGGFTFLPSGNNRVENNILYFSRSALNTYINIGPNTAPSTFSFSNNLWYAYDNPSQSTPILPATETAGKYGENPLFSNAGAGDYSLSTNSPAIAMGSSPAFLSRDIAGNGYNNPPSIGAYEGDPSMNAVPVPAVSGFGLGALFLLLILGFSPALNSSDDAESTTSIK